ncbi:hypothetical protein [Aureliella helgolandensis]|uniref:Secreted protein n=1 Tax=Aureliella helgolandensis TaxID=2527968 RepID=A0A518G017_9BACT|nr:hypothetical protein [Aureliella helgolandensis]QDV21890.1 hypothetical protein Q31a_01690 [Aureliella helgolandensis]
MRRLIAVIATLAGSVLTVGTLSAQIHDHRGYHSYHHQTANAARLAAYVGQLEEVCKHLHDDTHDLSQDYRHSQAIESHIDQLESLKVHMHEILTQAVERGHYSSQVDRHIKEDLLEAKSLFSAYHRLLQGQLRSGARSVDYHTLKHMQEVLLHEAFPLVSQIESELYGRRQYSGYPLEFRGTSSVHEEHRVARPTWVEPSIPSRPTYTRPSRIGEYPGGRGSRRGDSSGRSISIGGFRIQF